jgi:hypothetical protein
MSKFLSRVLIQKVQSEYQISGNLYTKLKEMVSLAGEEQPFQSGDFYYWKNSPRFLKGGRDFSLLTASRLASGAN